MMRYLLLQFLFVCFVPLLAQKIDIFSDSYFPAKPHGGKAEVQTLFNQTLVYPSEAIESKIEGNVFIAYEVNTEGRVIQYKTDSLSPSILHDAALNVFKLILWEKQPNESKSRISKEKIKVKFHLRKYKKQVKKRGYEHLPQPKKPIDSSYRVYSINQLDEKPEVTNATSLNAYVSKNFNFPSIALQRGISGRVSVEFIIEPYGFISNVRITEALAGGCNEETIRLMRGLNWQAGTKNGKAVRTLYKYQLNFVNPGGSIRK